MPHTAGGEDRGPYLLDRLVNTVTDYAIFALDVDGCIATWNAGAARMKGYDASEIIGQHFSRFYPAQDVAGGLPDRELAIAAADGRFEDEGWRLRKDGSRFWANVVITALRGPDGRLIGFGKVTRDLTERRRTEEALRESEERFRLLVGGVADYAIFLLDPDGTIASWNLGAERLKGYRADEIIGRDVSQFYSEEDRRNGVPAAALREALEVGRWESEGWRIRKDGTRFWANVLITALRSPDGRHRGFAKVTRDLTDRKRNEDALRGVLARERDAAAQLRELDRMRTELIAVIAHDLRAPVGVIQHLAHRLGTGWDSLPDDDRRAILDRIAARTATLGALVDDVFDMVLIDAGRLDVAAAPFEMAAVVADVVADLDTSQSERSIKVTVGPKDTVVGDARRTWQVLTNLLSNAVKFSPPDEPIVIAVERVGDDVVVAVTDAGPGIPQEQQHLLFQRFTRLPTGAGVPGSGVGLFITKSLIEAQGGRVSVQSMPGVGSTFRFSLPAAP